MPVRIDSFNLSEKILELYKLTAELEEMYPGRHFTPDGHMVGSLGEVYAQEKYDLRLFEASHAVHDAVSPENATESDGRLVQIKATQGSSIAISESPKFLLVLKINHEGNFEEIYNGPGEPAMKLAGKKQKTGQQRIALSKLKALQPTIDQANRIPERDDAAK